MMRTILILAFTAIFLQSCKSNQIEPDASGTFEAEDVIVSSELGGQILTLNLNEGDSLGKGQIVGTIDADNIALQKAQVEATIQSLSQKTANVSPQVNLLQNQLAAQQSQIDHLVHERERTRRLLEDDAATGKQLDDINAQIDVAMKQLAVTQQQINVQKSNVATQNRSILSESKPLRKQAAQLEERLSKSKIINPINGVVLTKYAEQGEVTAPGKALYKIADVSELILRAYVTGTQLAEIKLNQPVKVLIDKGAKDYRSYTGKIILISDKAEFTPKTIQTKDERANLVYAVKVAVKNDGFMKIGMYGEVLFNERENR
jgi:HlyD family secretion protein